MSRHYINFRDKKYLYFHEFRQEWKKEYPYIHIMICSAEYKKATRLIFKYKDKRYTYYLKDELAEQLSVHTCIIYLMDTLERVWFFDSYCNRY